MDEKLGVKETKELLEGVLELSLVLISVFKDGVQLQDAMELWDKLGKDPLVKAKFQSAFEGYKSIAVEMKDLDAYEGVELASCLLAFLPRLLESLKEKKM